MLFPPCSVPACLIFSQHWVRACAPEKNVFSIASFIQSLLCLPLLLKMLKGGKIILHWHLLHSSYFVHMISPYYLHTRGVNTLNPALQVGTWGFREFKFMLEWVVDSCPSFQDSQFFVLYNTVFQLHPFIQIQSEYCLSKILDPDIRVS